jgi:hypothetical protein
MQPQRISGLCASIVPHREWPLRKWYYANPHWYYHRKGSDGEIVANPKFYQLVDPDLRAVCHLLNTAGLQTTPSCQGHFFERSRFQTIWEVLWREESLIRDHGLVVKDSETDREALFQEAGYQVPWKSFDEFFEQAGDHQGTGYLGILIPSDRRDLAERFRQPYRSDAAKLSENQELGRRLGGELFQLLVRTRGAAERSEEWRRFTEWVRDLLKDQSERAA